MNTKKKSSKQICVDGLMAFGELKNGLHTADFMCGEDVKMEAYSAKCKVQVMRDGNVYMTELPKRVRNKAIFRDDNSTLSLGRDGKFYFVFTLPQELVDELPEELVSQAGAIAQKVLRNIIYKL